MCRLVVKKALPISKYVAIVRLRKRETVLGACILRYELKNKGNNNNRNPAVEITVYKSSKFSNNKTCFFHCKMIFVVKIYEFC